MSIHSGHALWGDAQLHVHERSVGNIKERGRGRCDMSQ